MAKIKTKKRTSIYLMALFAVALVIAGVLIYLWVRSFTPASEASTGPFVDYTGTMHFNDRENTLVLGTLKQHYKDVNYEGDPVIRTENKIKEIQTLVKQAEDLIAAVTGDFSTTPSDEPSVPADNVLSVKDYVTPVDDELPFNDFIVEESEMYGAEEKYNSYLEETEAEYDFDKDSAKTEAPKDETPTTWLGKTVNAVKSFFGKAMDTVKSWFGKKQTSPVESEKSIAKPKLTSFRVVPTVGDEAYLYIYGENLIMNRTQAEDDEQVVIMYTDSANKMDGKSYDNTQFFGTKTEITVIDKESKFENLSTIYFESMTRGLSSTSKRIYDSAKQTVPVTGGEPETVKAEASLTSFRAENLAIGGAKIVIKGKNLKINSERNMAPERGSKLTVFFDDFTNIEFKDTKFLVADNEITAYSTKRFRKVSQVYFESPTLGLKGTQNGTTITQPPINKPKITGYEIENYSIYDQLVIEGENLLISTNRSDKDEQIVIMHRDRTSQTYASNEFYGSKTKINLIGDVDEFSNIDTIYFESKTRGLTSSSNKLSLINIANFLVGKVLASTGGDPRHPLGDSSQRFPATFPPTDWDTRTPEDYIKSHQQAYDNLRERISDALDRFDIYREELNSYMGSISQLTDEPTDNDLSMRAGLTVVPRRATNSLPQSATTLENQLKNAKNSLSSLERNDPVLKMWNTASKYQKQNILPTDLNIRYSTGGVIFAELYRSSSEIESVINQMTDNKIVLNALAKIGRPDAKYDIAKWIRQAQKTAKNYGPTGNGEEPIPTMIQTI